MVESRYFAYPKEDKHRRGLRWGGEGDGENLLNHCVGGCG